MTPPVTRFTAPALAAAYLCTAVALTAQAGAAGGRGAPPVASARASAPSDLTGYWVAVISQDWRWRMVTPPRGDYASVPITLEAKKMGDAWDPAKDEAAGEACRAYGAPGLMALPTRLHITWQDDETLRMDADAGTQTRLFRFAAARVTRRGALSWQGESVAEWTRPRPAPGTTPKGGSLKVVTTNLRPGYLRRNGVPYGADAVLTEHWDLFTDPSGDQWIGITRIMEDPKFLREPWVTVVNFRKEHDGAKWEPTPCT